MADTASLHTTPLHGLHVRHGARMTPFAGYDMPVQFDGVIAEHRWTRERAGLFDVSHMGQIWLRSTEAELGAPEAHAAVASAIETLVPGEIQKLKMGAARYTMLLNDAGGIVDDLIITRPARAERQGDLVLVVNAARKAHDEALIRERLGDRVAIDVQDQRSLIALQGPEAAEVLGALISGIQDQTFMTMRPYEWRGASLLVTRCGYTGEDGFEVSVPDAHAEDLSEALLANEAVKPIGLGARDTLRLEAGLCLYGQDLDETVSPVEAGLTFAIGKRRRAEGGFPGADRVLGELREGPARRLVGLALDGRAPARTGAEIVANDASIGVVTSGGFSPSLEHPIALGFVTPSFAAPGTGVHILVRGKPLTARVTSLPFHPHRYVR